MTNALFIEYPVYCSHSAHNVTLRRIQNLNGFSLRFFCSHSAHNVTLRRIQNLNGFSIGFFCSHSAHNVTLRRIQNFNDFFYRFILHAQRDARSYTKLEWLFYQIFCSHSVRNVTIACIHRLTTSVGLAQAHPN